MYNLIMLTDSYKLSHFDQYPSKMRGMQSYLEARGGAYKDIVFFGLDYIIKTYFTQITTGMIDEAEAYANAHGLPFNREGWEYIATLDGLPVRVVAKPEGTICSVNEPLLTIESTDEKAVWLVNYLETLLMKVWYPCTVASKALSVRKLLTKHYEKTGANTDAIAFSYHNFGDRGATSVEAAAIGGAAHLLTFSGTDNFNALRLIDNTYINSDSGIGFSIPATEHSTVTSWGKKNEFSMYDNYLEKNKGKNIIACVMDSYNIYDAVHYITTTLKRKIESVEYPTFVIRPDSGNPLDVIPSIIGIMESNNVAYKEVGSYKLFDKYRIIWGDGISPEAIDKILDLVVSLGYSPENIAFGSGGDLMQKLDRDTCKFAIKCCAVRTESGEWEPVFKSPLHDGFKVSKAGYQTVKEGVVYYENGWINTQHISFVDIRLQLQGGLK
jgi:nicotinamide phosphoribosyltransferase